MAGAPAASPFMHLHYRELMNFPAYSTRHDEFNPTSVTPWLGGQILHDQPPPFNQSLFHFNPATHYRQDLAGVYSVPSGLPVSPPEPAWPGRWMDPYPAHESAPYPITHARYTHELLGYAGQERLSVPNTVRLEQDFPHHTLYPNVPPYDSLGSVYPLLSTSMLPTMSIPRTARDFGHMAPSRRPNENQVVPSNHAHAPAHPLHLPSSSELENLMPSAPTFTCQVDNCCQSVIVDPEGLRHHVQQAHGVRTGQAVLCMWTGCTSADGSARRPARKRASGVHVQDLAEHIWQRHLGFRFVCPGCDQTNLKDQLALDRHRHECPGRIPARCGICFTAFESKLELVKHARLSKCGTLEKR